MMIHNIASIKVEVVERETVMDNEPFFLVLDILECNGRAAYGCRAFRQLANEKLPRASYRTEAYTIREEALSEGWELYLSLEPTQQDTHSYVGRKKCGCIASAVAEGWPDLLDDIKKWRKEGAIIDRVTHQYVRENFQGRYCPHEPEQKSLFDEVTR